METKKPFWAWVFSEQDGTPSLARVGTAVLVAFICGWDTCYTVFAWQWNMHHLVPGQTPIAMWLDPLVYAGQGAFMLALYGANKAAGIFRQ